MAKRNSKQINKNNFNFYKMAISIIMAGKKNQELELSPELKKKLQELAQAICNGLVDFNMTKKAAEVNAKAVETAKADSIKAECEFSNDEEVEVRMENTNWEKAKYIGMLDSKYVAYVGRIGIFSFPHCRKIEERKEESVLPEKSRAFEKSLIISLSFHEHTGHFFVNFSNEKGFVISSLLTEPVAIGLSNALDIAIGK